MTTRTDREPVTNEQTMPAHLAVIQSWGVMGDADRVRLANVTQPILVVNGSDDTMIPTVNAFTCRKSDQTPG